MKKLLPFLILGLTASQALAQPNNNGKLDRLEEFTTYTTVPFTMPDGVKLMTDVYLPITSDSMVTSVTIGGVAYNVEIIPKGTQLFVYDSIGGQPNSNQYQLPMVFTRTPYGKGDYNTFGMYMNILGFAYALQDMRGRYESEGVYYPMYSDGWKKDAYHPTVSHILDVTSTSDPHNAIYHEDGKSSIQFIMDSLYREYDLDNNDTVDLVDKTYNGSLAMFGASALGNTQYQAASAFKQNTAQDGLKGLLPIVATLEYFNSTVQHNGVFRRALVQGWIEGQMRDVLDTIPSDTLVQNNIHSIFDYGMSSADSIMALAVDQFSVIPDANGYSAMYPNYQYRSDMDGSYAPVNNLGESDVNGALSRYSNMSLPVYHLTGWWDIFIDGQLETYQHIMDNNSTDIQQNQKIVIGPWTHATIGQDTVADIVYPQSVFDVRIAGSIGDNIGMNSITELVKGEVVEWLRYLLNYETGKELGEPKVLIPESQKWQNIGANDVRIPSQDYYITYSDFLNFMGGYSDLTGMPVEIRNGSSIIPYSLDLPADTSNQIPGQSPLGNPATPQVDFKNIPNIRYYVPGHVNDGIAQNQTVGNYWTSTDVFPLNQGIEEKAYYLHGSGVVDTTIPTVVETPLSYTHNPDNPVFTVGGGNLAVPTPQFDRVSAGPMNYADTNFAPYTMDRADVLQFETDAIQDSLTIVGIPRVKLYAKTTPNGATSGPTDTDFFVRIIDVYPDGREYFVVEGAVNARARDYAKSLANGNENIQAPYTNINIGQTYEYEFNMLPIAYSFGHQHKMKVLISSSNWPRYQSNPNLPIEQGEFFRREPGDGKTYTFNNVIMTPRIAEQTVLFSPNEPTQIILPVRKDIAYASIIEDKEDFIEVYPNPTKDKIWITTNGEKSYSCQITDISGRTVDNFLVNSTLVELNLVSLPCGMYLLRLKDEEGNGKILKVIKE